ncbi:MAG: HD-GYP domain-containing protein [Planctomycetota bacterium]|jgi:HD-GYP domain-containing protein (c-di-GMP phosphodiesterase class II)
MDIDTKTKDRLVFEIMLIVVVIGMAYLMLRMGAYSIVALNLFYLPIVLSGYFLGRRSAGILAFFCVISVTISATLNSTGFAAYTTPIMVGLVITVWAAVLGLTALLVGTLSDERAQKLEELHEAYVGVVDVLSAYLQSADPKCKAKSTRVAELSQRVAKFMRLPSTHIDDIRIAALLHDMSNIEVTTRLLSRAVNSLESADVDARKHTFLGSDLAQSLGSVMHGAVPLVVAQNDDLREMVAAEMASEETMPIGAMIIRTVRAFDDQLISDGVSQPDGAVESLDKMVKHSNNQFDPNVVEALRQVITNHSSIPGVRELVPAT